MGTVTHRLWRALQMDRKTVATDAGVERLVDEVHRKTEFLLVVLDSYGQIINQKLRSEAGDLCGYLYCRAVHRTSPPNRFDRIIYPGKVCWILCANHLRRATRAQCCA